MDSELMICEEHPFKEWPHDSCGGPGMPASNLSRLIRESKLVANPDYEATAIVQHARNMYGPVWLPWANLSTAEKVSRISLARRDVDAALGIQGGS